jgi:hypothetical protein
VEQLSRPYQIALGAILVLAAAWFLVLKPGDAASEPTAVTAPGVTGLGNAVTEAEGASAASDAANAATAAASAAASGEAPASAPAAAVATPGASTRVPAATSAAARAAAADAAAARKDPSSKVLRWLDRGNVAVVTFYAREAADDKAVRRVLKRLDRRRGNVRVFAADIAKVGSYEAITRGVSVLQAPTTLVISPDRRARKIVGYLDRAEVQQRVDDVLADAEGDLDPAVHRKLRRQAREVCGKGKAAKACRAHLAEVNSICAAGVADALSLGIGAASAGQDKATLLATLLERAAGMTDRVAQARPPAAQAAEHAFLVASMRKELAAMRAAGPDPAAVAAMKPDAVAEARARKAGYGACTSRA